MAGETGEFIVRPIQEDDRLNKFEIAREDDALRAFLKKAAMKFSASNIAKTYVAVEKDEPDKRVRSYISILLSEISKRLCGYGGLSGGKQVQLPGGKDRSPCDR